MIQSDTIAAISSAAGSCARIIVRCSGQDARTIADKLAHPGPCAVLMIDGMPVPIARYDFRAPRSYTGEDLVEFHLPGNPILAHSLLTALLGNGARAAEAGEFTARAYFNGRLNLTEAEGVAAQVAAQNDDELRAARQLMAGELVRRLQPAMDFLAQTLALVEAGIDFADEGIDVSPGNAIAGRITSLELQLHRLIAESSRFTVLSHEPRIVLVGRPNAGKSTLINALAARERAIVSPVAGTTRDVLEADVPLRRGIVRLLDVAGIDTARDRATGVSDVIEQQMHDHAMRAMGSADVVVLVEDMHDRSSPTASLWQGRVPDLHILTKNDGGKRASVLSVSAHTGFGMPELRAALDEVAFGNRAGGEGWGVLALNTRHFAGIATTREALDRALGQIESGAAEIVAMELREALDALGSVIGQVTPDDVLGRIFSSFCIGK